MQKMTQNLMQVQAQKVDAKVGETKLGAKLDAKPGAKDGTKLGIKPSEKPTTKCIAIHGAKLGVRLGAKLDANFASCFSPYLISGCKQHHKWALDAKNKANMDVKHIVLLQCEFFGVQQVKFPIQQGVI